MDTLIMNNKTTPDFELPDLDGNVYKLSKYRGRVIILNFWSAECPWSASADQGLLSYLSGWGEGVSLWSVASNANEPVELLGRTAAERSLPVVLLDSHQVVADLYGTKTTPHFFIVDEGGILRYQGAMNDVTFRQPTPTRDYLREAVDAILSDRLPDPSQTSPYGCAIVRFAN
jgi:hypothetical protein